MSNTFLYFAYGSNLFAKRIHINNPTAVRKGIGYLKNFRLDFNGHSKAWNGATATIVPEDNSVVWGAIWEMNKSDLPSLDHQEGVSEKIYFPLTVDVNILDGRILSCRVYEQYNNPKEYVKPELLPDERKPAPLYIETILKGAYESKLPEEYIQFLKRIPNNGYNGKYKIE